MDDNDIYELDSDSDFEDLVNSDEDIQIIYFDNIDQFKESQKELKKIGGFEQDSNIVQYIIMNPVK